MFSVSKGSSISPSLLPSVLPSQLPSRISIVEANSHLQMVHSRVEQLEAIIDKQCNQLVAIEHKHKHQINTMNASNELNVCELNAQIDSLTEKIKQLEHKVDEQNATIIESNRHLRKLMSIKKYEPHLDKLVKLLKSLDMMTTDGNTSINQENNIEIVNKSNGVNNTSDKVYEHKFDKTKAKKFTKYNSERNKVIIQHNGGNTNTNTNTASISADNDTILLDTIASTSSSTTSGQSPANSSSISRLTSSSSLVQNNRKSLTSKLNIARSFNITSNFSDDDEDLSENRKISIRGTNTLMPQSSLKTYLNK